MKILIYGINYAPEDIGIGKYTGEMVDWLSRHGHDVRVVCAPPYYPQWKVKKPYHPFRFQVEKKNQVTVYRCPLYVPEKVSTLKRIVHLLSFALSSLVPLGRCLPWRPDVVINVVPALFTSPMALLFSKLYGAKSIIHIQDFEIDAMLGLGMAGEKKSLASRIVRNIEGWLYGRFDTVSSISNSMIANAIGKGVYEDRTYHFANWCTPFHPPSEADVASFRKTLGVESHQKLVLYSGNIGEKQGLENVIESAKAFETLNPDVRFLIAGQGATKKRLMALANEKSVTNLRFSDLLPFDDLPKLLCAADVHLVIQKAGAADAVLPSKLTNILAAGGHAVITAERLTELGHLCEKYPGIGICVEPEDVALLTEGIQSALSLAKPNLVARNYAQEHLDYDHIMVRFNDHLTSLLTDVVGEETC